MLLLPRVLPDAVTNVFRRQRLTDKLGNRSDASYEPEARALSPGWSGRRAAGCGRSSMVAGSGWTAWSEAASGMPRSVRRMPSLYREAPLNSIRQRSLAADTRFTVAVDCLRSDLRDVGEGGAWRLAEPMALVLVLQGALLVRDAPTAVTCAFWVSHQVGTPDRLETLPPGVSVGAGLEPAEALAAKHEEPHADEPAHS